MTTLNQILLTSSEKYAAQIALTMQIGFRTVNLTYAEVYELARKTAVLLAQQGIQPGDKILICAPNSPYWGVAFWGCLLRGAVLVPLNTQSTSQMLQAIVQATQASLLFKWSHCRLTLPAGVKTFDLELLPELLAPLALADYQPVDCHADDLIQIMYTSGTTGQPKGVMHTHRNLLASIQSLSQAIPLRPGHDRLLSILPLSHIYEQTVGLLLPYSYGIQVVYAHTPSAIRPLLKQYRITRMLAVPEFLQLFMRRIELSFAEKKRLWLFNSLLRISQLVHWQWFSRLLFYPVLRQFGGKLHTIASGGAALDPALLVKWEALGITILQGYGLTETSPVVATNTYQAHRPGSVGLVVPGVQIKFSPKQEILVKGANVFQGYYQLPEKTAQVLSPDGWFNTEDLGELDQDQFLWIKGREKYLIKGPGGQNVYPEDIEFELLKAGQGCLKDCCVLGVEQHHTTEIHAVLLFEPTSTDLPNCTPESLIEQANQQLASYQQIHAWTVWSDTDFPRTATRKIKKPEVLAQLLQAATNTDAMSRPIAAGQNQKLANILAQITGVPLAKITPTTNLTRELKLDSLLRVELVATIEAELRVAIAETDITAKTTVADLEQLLANPKPLPPQPALKRWPTFWWARWLRALLQPCLFLALRPWLKVRVTGTENLYKLKEPFILMPNHISYLDGVAALLALPRDLRARVRIAGARDFMYQEYAWIVWLVDLVFNSFPIQREGENVKLGLEHLGQVLDSGYTIMLFPEGQVSRSGELLPLKNGAGLIAVDMRVPVIPLKIGSEIQRLFPYECLLPHGRGTVTVTIGAPLRFKISDSYITATEQIERAMRDL